MQKISQLLGYMPIDVHSHFDHGVPGDYRTVVEKCKQQTHVTSLDILRKKYDTAGIGQCCFFHLCIGFRR